VFFERGFDVVDGDGAGDKNAHGSGMEKRTGGVNFFSESVAFFSGSRAGCGG